MVAEQPSVLRCLHAGGEVNLPTRLSASAGVLQRGSCCVWIGTVRRPASEVVVRAGALSLVSRLLALRRPFNFTFFGPPRLKTLAQAVPVLPSAIDYTANPNGDPAVINNLATCE